MAFAGIWLSTRFVNPVFDSAVSIVIGCLLTVVSLILIRESRGLLLGEAMGEDATDDIRRIVGSCKGVIEVSRPLTLYFGPEVILLAMDMEFALDLTAGEVIRAVACTEGSVRRRYPKIQRI